MRASGGHAAASQSRGEAKAPNAETTRPAVPVQLAPARHQPFEIWLDGLGTVIANQSVIVHAQVDGRLEAVKFVEGQRVKKGDVLAQIDPRPFQVQLHQAEGQLLRDQAQLDAAKADLDRQLSLKAQNLVAQAQVDVAQGNVGNFTGAVAIDRAAIEAAKLNLDYAAVKAPLDGITGVRQVDAGNIVHATDPNGIVVITAIEPAAVVFTLPQDRLVDVTTALAGGDVPVEVWNRDGSQKLATGTLAVLDNQVNAATSTMRLKAIIPNNDHKLWPNAFVKARVLVATRKDAVVVPAAAIQQGPQGTYVYVVADATAHMTPVTVELTSEDTSVISKGLSGGERVVIEGANQLKNNGKVDTGEGKGEGSGKGKGSGERTRAPK